MSTAAPHKIAIQRWSLSRPVSLERENMVIGGYRLVRVSPSRRNSVRVVPTSPPLEPAAARKDDISPSRSTAPSFLRPAVDVRKEAGSLARPH